MILLVPEKSFTRARTLLLRFDTEVASEIPTSFTLVVARKIPLLLRILLRIKGRSENVCTKSVVVTVEEEDAQKNPSEQTGVTA